jgi:serine phosphatase RsbU (regulator of sigma subunit)
MTALLSSTSTAASGALPFLAAANGAVPNELNGVRFSTTSLPADGVSGDFVVIMSRGEQLCVVIGDACGTGVPASRLVDIVKPYVLELGDLAETPSELLMAVNDAIAGELGDNVFVTAAALFIDTQTGRATCANAGHVPPMLRRGGRTQLIGSASGPPLGMLPNSTYTDTDFRVRQGDMLLLMTDGIPEAVEEDLMTMPRLQALFGSAPRNLGAITECILSEVARRATRVDDRAIVGLEVTARPGAAPSVAAAVPVAAFEMPTQQAA